MSGLRNERLFTQVIKNEDGDGCPSTFITDYNAEQVFDRVLHNRRVTMYELVHQVPMKLSPNRLAVHRAFSLWFRKQHTERHKEICLDIREWLLNRYGPEGDHILERILTGDEIWIHH